MNQMCKWPKSDMKKSDLLCSHFHEKKSDASHLEAKKDQSWGLQHLMWTKPYWICMWVQSVKCFNCLFNLFYFTFVLYNKFHSTTWLHIAALWECDVDKWAITGAIFMCHICGQHDPRLALLMLNVRCESCACQYRRLGRQRGPFWHVIHHWFHSAATAVSLSLCLSQAADPTEDAPAGWSNISLG